MKSLRWLLLAPALATLGSAGIGAPGSQPYYAYVSDSSGYVAIYDMRQIPFPMIHSENVSPNPAGIVAAPSRGRVYVGCTSTSSTIDVIDTSMNIVVAAEQMILNSTGNSSPTELLISPDDRWLWVGCSMPGGSGIIRIDLDAGNVVEQIFLDAGGAPMLSMALRPGQEFGGGAGQPTRLFAVLNNSKAYQVDYNGLVQANSTGNSNITINGANGIAVSPDYSKVYITAGNGALPQYRTIGVDLTTGGALSVTPPGADHYEAVAFAKQNGPTPYAYLVRSFFAPGSSLMPVTADTELPGSHVFVALTHPQSIAIDPSGTWAFVGDLTFDAMVAVDLTNPADLTLANSFTLPTVTAATHAAFLPVSGTPLQLFNVCPRGIEPLPGQQMMLEGAGFVPGSAVTFGSTALVVPGEVTFIDSNHLMIAPVNIEPGQPTVLVTNPDAGTAQLMSCVRYTVPGPLLSFDVPPGSTSQDYAMYSLPQVTLWPAFKAGLIAAFGPYNPSVWRAFAWSPRAGRYLEFPEIPDDYCDVTGTSMWILSKNGGTVSAPGLDSDTSQANLPQVLYPGWNMMSWPYDTQAGDWLPGQAFVEIGNAADPPTFTAADPNPYGNSLLFEWTGSAYGLAARLEPRKGYWVFNAGSQPCYLYFDNAGMLGRRRAPEMTPARRFGPEPGEPSGYAMLGLPRLLASPSHSGAVAFASRIMGQLPPPPPSKPLAESKTPACSAAPETPPVRALGIIAIAALLALLGRRIGAGLLR